MSDLLKHEIVLPDDPADGAPVAVLLHGRGSNRHDLPGLAPHLPAGTIVVAPEAPWPGATWGYGSGWAWYRYREEDRVVVETLTHSLERLDAFMEALPSLLPVRPGAVVLGGFSQGGTTSLAWGITRPGRVDGLVVLSGFLVDAPDAVPVGDDPTGGVPVFWGHGTHDPAIPFALARRGRERLTAAGTPLTTHDYPIGHGVVNPELEDLGRFLRSLDGA